MPQIKSYNDLVYAVAKRARELSDMRMNALRSTCGYGCDTDAEAIRLHRYAKRGELVEYALVEEFCEETDVDFSE